jgi:hypothetical protein
MEELAKAASAAARTGKDIAPMRAQIAALFNKQQRLCKECRGGQEC